MYKIDVIQKGRWIGMLVTGDAVSQGVVLVSILAGFSFVIATEISLRGDKSFQMESIAYEMFLVGIICLTAVVIGIIYFLNTGNDYDQAVASNFFFVALVIAIIGFVVAMFSILQLSFAEKILRNLLFLTIMVCVIGTLLLFLYTRG